MIKLFENVPFLQKDYNNIENLDAPSINEYIIGDANHRLPTILVVPGGGYVRKSDAEGEPFAKWLNDNGYNAFVLNYRVFPYNYPVPLIDIIRAIKYIKYYSAQFGVDVNNIGVMGFSAGAHLCSLLGETVKIDSFYKTNDKIDEMTFDVSFCILCYPVISMEKKYRHEGSYKAFLPNIKSNYYINKLSTYKHIGANFPKTFIWHTKEDNSVPYYNSVLFVDRLKELGIYHEFYLYEKGAHGLKFALDVPGTKEWSLRCLEFIKKVINK
ncbi:MAG: alpha/beta hydrolase [Acholeplasmatales bacterium]|jgi:acetyl esterase/lipase|nr:alpha/beta hydrolase [Acholeplasmatales bacterium]